MSPPPTPTRQTATSAKTPNSDESTPTRTPPRLRRQPKSAYQPPKRPRRRMSGFGLQAASPSQQWAKVTETHMKQNRVVEAHVAFELFELGRYEQAAELLNAIIYSRASEAIRARAFALLAREEFGASLLERCNLLQGSLAQWDVVIKQTGLSRYPVEKAKVERAEVEKEFDRLLAAWVDSAQHDENPAKQESSSSDAELPEVKYESEADDRASISTEHSQP